MNKIKLFAALAGLMLLVCSCTASPRSEDFFAMDTFMNIKLYGNGESIKAAKEEIYRIDELFGWDSMDKSSEEVKALAEEAFKISDFTDGAFDITVAPLLDLWGFRTKKYAVPREEQIQEALKTVGYNNQVDTYDFGGIAKGYAGDKVSSLLKERGIDSAIISLGGNIHAIGTKPNGDLWKVGIQNPDGEGYVGYVKVNDCAVVTSGGYERYFESGEMKYSHIINPKSGKPADSGVKSVTVISKSGMLADALSTAFYVMGTEKTHKLCNASECNYDNIKFSVVLIDSENKIHTFGNPDFEEE